MWIYLCVYTYTYVVMYTYMNVNGTHFGWIKKTQDKTKTFGPGITHEAVHTFLYIQKWIVTGSKSFLNKQIY